MNPEKVFIYAEFQISAPFDQVDWEPINDEMKKFPGLKSKTWLSGINNHSLGGFYEFDSLDNAQNYIDELLVPVTKRLNGNLSVKLFNGDVVKEASLGMASPYY
jgi:Putative mono-oxygenase ydhR